MKIFFNLLNKKLKKDIFIDIARENLIQKQLKLKDLKSGKVYLIKNMSEIYKVKKLILDKISKKYGDRCFYEIESFFSNSSHIPQNPEICNNLINTINEIKNERDISAIFSDFISCFDINFNHTYLDTGYFRFMMPEKIIIS